MLRFAWITALIAVALTGIACNLVTAPISGARDLASTAEALATALPSRIPDIQDMPEIPGLPDVAGFLNPSGTPASVWKGIPIMPEASAGEEFDSNTYSFTAPGITGIEVEEFYDAKLEALGWSSPVRTNVGTAGGYMLFTKESNALNIVVVKPDGDIVVLLVMQ